MIIIKKTKTSKKAKQIPPTQSELACSVLALEACGGSFGRAAARSRLAQAHSGVHAVRD